MDILLFVTHGGSFRDCEEGTDWREEEGLDWRKPRLILPMEKREERRVKSRI